MYITTGDMVAVIIALLVSMILIITTAVRNARLTIARDDYRKAYFNYKFATEAEAMGQPYYWDSVSGTWKYRSESEQSKSDKEFIDWTKSSYFNTGNN